MLYRVNHDTTVQNFQPRRAAVRKPIVKGPVLSVRRVIRIERRIATLYGSRAPLSRNASCITALVDRSFVLTKAPDGEDTIAVSLLVYAL
jgi:hypothetical protein